MNKQSDFKWADVIVTCLNENLVIMKNEDKNMDNILGCPIMATTRKLKGTKEK